MWLGVDIMVLENLVIIASDNDLFSEDAKSLPEQILIFSLQSKEFQWKTLGINSE